MTDEERTALRVRAVELVMKMNVETQWLAARLRQAGVYGDNEILDEDDYTAYRHCLTFVLSEGETGTTAKEIALWMLVPTLLVARIMLSKGEIASARRRDDWRREAGLPAAAEAATKEAQLVGYLKAAKASGVNVDEIPEPPSS